MRDSDAQMLITMFGGRSILTNALALAPYPEEVQTSILEKFCECVFKRVLLCVPEEHIGSMLDIFEEFRISSAKTLEPFVAAMERLIPDINAYISEEIDRATTEFRVEELAIGS